MSAPHFLPWIRRGLARGIGGVDDPAGSLPVRGAVEVLVGLTDSRGMQAEAGATLPLVGPADVVGLEPDQVVRAVPPDGARDVEANYFPFVEVAAPDLPWMLTPAQAAGSNRLRPWLVLVCVEERDGVEYDGGGSPLPVLRIGGDLAGAELPDLSESWAWVHVQSMVPTGQVGGEVEDGTGAVIARFLCPRRLLEGRSYRAALVPAFDVGVEAGLGRDASSTTEAGPAWRHDALPATLELPVYFTWTFTTSTAPGDFEDLARRLEPDLEGGRLGIHDARLVDTGLLPPFGGSTDFEVEGSLVDPGSTGAELPEPAQTWFRPKMTELLEQSAGRMEIPAKPPRDYDPETDDPVIGPPFYGSWAADEYQVPPGGWLEELNLDPRRRSAAGLGTRVVREHQHELLAAAWDQVGEVRALREELNRGRLAAEVGRSHAARFAALEDAALLQATGRLHVFVPVGRRTAAGRARDSAVLPSAMLSSAFARQTRPGGLLARRAGTSRHQAAVSTRSLARFVAASVVPAERAPEMESLARFGATFTGVHTVGPDLTFRIVRVLGPDGSTFTEVRPVQQVQSVRTGPADDVTGLAARVRGALDPMPWIARGLARRVSGIQLDDDGDLPTRVQVGPRFPDPLFPWLHALGSDLVVPGIETFGTNRVRLLEVNESWIAAFLAGANHEWAREALWNEYPADPGATAFSTFWPRVPLDQTDLARDLHEWPPDEALADQVGGAGSSTVLLVRGDLIGRYPDAEFMLVEPAADGSILDTDGNLPPERVTWPAFTGLLDPDTAFVGFEVDPKVVRDRGWYAGIQEPIAGPRFGLDTADPAHHGERPGSWDDLSWGHMAATAEALGALTHISFAETTWLAGFEEGGLEWARNAAHLAGITFQQPFRLLLPASYLMPSSGDRR